MNSKRDYSLPRINRNLSVFLNSDTKTQEKGGIILIKTKHQRRPNFSNPTSRQTSIIKNLNFCKNSQRKIMVFFNEFTQTPAPNSFFSYQFTNSTSDPHNRLQEMHRFFELCEKKFNCKEKLDCIYSDSGAKIQSLFEIPDSSKYIIVRSAQLKKTGRANETSQRNHYKKLSHDIYRPTNLYSKSFLSRANDSFDSSFASFASKPKPHEKVLTDLKLKFGEASVRIESQLPKLNEIGIKSLCSKYSLSEGELHSLYARYKMLLLLSFSKDPSHQIASGINKSLFIDSFIYANDNSRKMLEKICSQIDSNNNQCIDLHEYLKAMTVLKHGTPKQQIDMFFDVYDTNRNGALSFDEIKELCRMQLYFTDSDGIVDYLSDSFASLIFDMADLGYDKQITAERLKILLENTKEKFIVEMFCSFNCLSN